MLEAFEGAPTRRTQVRHRRICSARFRIGAVLNHSQRMPQGSHAHVGRCSRTHGPDRLSAGRGALLVFLLRKYGQLPLDLPRSSAVLMMILRWQRVTLCDPDLVAAPEATIDPWVRGGVSRRVAFIQGYLG